MEEQDINEMCKQILDKAEYETLGYHEVQEWHKIKNIGRGQPPKLIEKEIKNEEPRKWRGGR